MTDPDKLEGEELAAAVATEVMGWGWVKDFTGDYRPDRDMNQAMEVAHQACRVHCMHFILETVLGKDGNSVFWAHVFPVSEQGDSVWVPAKSCSIATAICRACLKAVRAAQ